MKDDPEQMLIKNQQSTRINDQEILVSTILNNLDIPIFSIDRTYCYTLFNQRYISLMKDLYGVDIGIGKNLLEYIKNPVELSKTKQNIDRALAGEQVIISDYRGEESQRRSFFTINHSPVRDSVGEIIGVAVIFQNITERVHAKEALFPPEEICDNIFNNVLVGIFQATPDGRLVKANEPFARIFGYPNPGEMLAEVTNIAVQLFAQAGDWKKMVSSLMERDVMEPHEYSVCRRDGTQFWVSTTARTVRDLNGALIYYEGTCVDITKEKMLVDEQKKFTEDLQKKILERAFEVSEINQKLVKEIEHRTIIEQELTKSLEEKVILLREVHHRVKNNLQIIISLLNLQSRYIKDETILAAIRESQNRIKAMSMVHEKLYQSADISKIDLDDYVRFLCKNLFQYFGIKGTGVTFTTDISNIFLDINTAISTGLILNELISNSLKYAFPDARKREISIAIKREKNMLSVMYKDNGIGIPKDFEWRDAKSLGLRLVIALVEQLEGTIELDRNGETMFTMILKEKV